ncbi:MAG: sialate O-acetylesterase [Clostridiales bacterium]|nr:sialate O-acetylesterase [Clostridiales bacterium]
MFKAAPLFGDHAILPLGKELRIFGTADECEVIRARLTAADGTVTGEGEGAAHSGRFLIHLPPQRAEQGPLTLTLTSAAMTWTAVDWQVGYLFLAGGQSNMEWSLWNAEGGQEIIRTHQDAALRYFNVPRVSLEDEVAQAAHAAAHWQQIAPHQGGDMSAVAYFFATEVRRRTGLPVGIIGCNWGGTSILSWMDEAALHRCIPALQAAEEYERQYGHITLPEWQSQQDAFQAAMDAWNKQVEAIKAAQPGIEWAEVEKQAGACPWNPPPGPGSPYRPGQLARTMVASIVPAALTGVLFYQGESDVAERAACYAELLITLVLRWRELFGDATLPFYNVQLPMYIDANAQDDHGWAILRQQQEMALHALRNSHLAVMIDAGEYGNIHPVDKRTPGQRLARLFLEQVEQTAPAQPWAVGKSTRGNVLTVEVTHPLRGEPDLFEVAGEDGVYVPACAVLEDCCIHLTAEGVAHPAKARYAWVNWGRVHVYGETGLPLAPFVLDD